MEPQLDQDCLTAVLVAACTRPGQLLVCQLCRMACVNREWRQAAYTVLATQVITIQTASFGPRANAIAARAPALCLPTGHLDLCALLARCTGLQRLSLAGLHTVASDQLLAVVAASCRELWDVELDFCSGVTDAGLAELVQGAPRLRRLSLRNCQGLHSAAVLGQLSRLEELDLTWCKHVEAEALAGSAGTLRRLCLHGCEVLGDEVCGRLPLVEELVLAFTAVTDEGLAALAAASPRLRILVLGARSFNLWQTGRWTDGGLAAFKAAAPQAKVILVAC